MRSPEMEEKGGASFDWKEEIGMIALMEEECS